VAGIKHLIVGIPVTVLVKLPVVDIPLTVVGVPVDIHGENFVS
jgi:hypothetical protein